MAIPPPIPARNRRSCARPASYPQTHLPSAAPASVCRCNPRNRSGQPVEGSCAALADQARPSQADAVGQVNIADAELCRTLDDLEHRVERTSTVVGADERDGHAQGDLDAGARRQLDRLLDVAQVFLDGHVRVEPLIRRAGRDQARDLGTADRRRRDFGPSAGWHGSGGAGLVPGILLTRRSAFRRELRE